LTRRDILRCGGFPLPSPTRILPGLCNNCRNQCIQIAGRLGTTGRPLWRGVYAASGNDSIGGRDRPVWRKKLAHGTTEAHAAVW
jgi:hypothetical protein